jgi:hypothetical protein
MSEPLTAVPAPEPDDQEPAPYGRRVDGTPKAKPGRPRGGGMRSRLAGAGAGAGRRRRAAAKKVPAPGKTRARPASSAASSAKPNRRDYATRLMLAGKFLTWPLALRPATQPDAVAVGEHLPPICKAIEESIEDLPNWLVGALDSVAKIGPYSKIAEAASPLIAQVLTNHGVLPIGVSKHMGAVPPRLLMMRAAARARREASADAADMAAWQAEADLLAAELADDDDQADAEPAPAAAAGF